VVFMMLLDAESGLLNKSVITIYKFYNVIANESCDVSVKDPIRILIMSTKKFKMSREK
jgi:hypothetical protein